VPSEHVRFPDRETAVGRLIDAHLRCTAGDMDDHAVHLLFSANRWEKKGEIMCKIHSGTTLVMDRYCHSGAAYSIAKGLPSGWCMSSDAGMPAPDLTVYLKLDVDTALDRFSASEGRERFENVPFQERAKRAFEGPDFFESSLSVHTVDASAPVDEVARTIFALAADLLMPGKKSD
jgi:dTMP kinase